MFDYFKFYYVLLLERIVLISSSHDINDETNACLDFDRF